jgi:hypothetical protein
MMNTVCTYHIQIRGRIDEAEINTMSPVQMVRDWAETAVTQFSVHTDQSGVIGLLRHLHSLGFVFLSVNCEG